MSDLALDSPQVESRPTGFVSLSLVQLEGRPVDHLEDGQLRGELQAVRLHPGPHSHSAWESDSFIISIKLKHNQGVQSKPSSSAHVNRNNKTI